MIFSIKPQIFELKCVFSYFRLKTHITLLLPVYVHSWEQRKLGELALFNPKDELPQIFEYVDLESVVGTEMLSHRTEVKSSAPSRAQRLAHAGDLFYQTVRPYQKNNYLFERPDNNYVFSTGYAQMRPYVDGYFLLSLVQSERFVKVVLDNCTGTSYPAINANDLAEIEVAAPSDESEAQKIGTIFRSIDNLITLHQCKCQIDGCRFQSPLAITWEQRKLGEVLISLQNNTLSRADLSSEEGIAKNIHYGDILVKFGEVIDVKTESLPMISDETVIAKYKSSFLQNGDVIVADTAEDETVGKCTEIAGLSDEIVISGLHTIPYRPLQKYAPGYLGYYMNSASFHNQLLPLMQGIKVTSISKTALQNTDILYPKSATEQAAIGTYFRNLDNLITLHQCE